MTHLVIGYGEVGQGLEKVLIEQGDEVSWYDTGKTCVVACKYNVLHICFPYGKTFEKDVAKYFYNFDPHYGIIHSTVPVGTTRKIQNEVDTFVAISPIQGTHPNLEKGIKTFRKWIGVKDESDLEKGEKIANEVFKNLRCKVTEPYEAVELAKLLDLSRYGLLISFAREQEKICEEHGVTYSEVVQNWELDYNEGLMLEGRSQYVRPILYPPKGRIGGHCIVPAMEKVKGESTLVERALEMNDIEGKETDAVLGKGTLIGRNVTIGAGTKIWHYVNILDNAKIGKNCVISSYVEIGEGVSIGDNCKIEAGAFIPKGVTIGDNVFIGPHVVFTNDRYPKIGTNWTCSETHVQSGASIGANATIVCGVRIGFESMIGAGAVVTKSVVSHETVCGCPARKLEKENKDG